MARSTQAASVPSSRSVNRRRERRGPAGCAGPPPPAGASSQAGSPSTGAEAAPAGGAADRTAEIGPASVGSARMTNPAQCVPPAGGRATRVWAACERASRVVATPRRSLTTNQTTAVSAATPTRALPT